jgi:hypothetical protein
MLGVAALAATVWLVVGAVRSMWRRHHLAERRDGYPSRRSVTARRRQRAETFSEGQDFTMETPRDPRYPGL